MEVGRVFPYATVNPPDGSIFTATHNGIGISYHPSPYYKGIWVVQSFGHSSRGRSLKEALANRMNTPMYSIEN